MINGATQRTFLGANFNGSTLQLNNTSAGASATALTLTVAAGHPPMKVNAATKVTNLNADYIDGIDSTGLVRATRVAFNLADGAVSAPITVPANFPVGVVGTSGVTGDLVIGSSRRHARLAPLVQSPQTALSPQSTATGFKAEQRPW